MIKLLLVEDDANLCYIIRGGLEDMIGGYEFVHLGKFMDEIKKGTDANEALKKVTGTYGRFTAEQGAVKHIDPRHE
jgi:hydrogenase maturation factor